MLNFRSGKAKELVIGQDGTQAASTQEAGNTRATQGQRKNSGGGSGRQTQSNNKEDSGQDQLQAIGQFHKLHCSKINQY
jgi:hypothetical protein